jgi:hypothetical protein
METCVVGCKLPNGLQINLAGVNGPTILKGNNATRIVGGYGLTAGVPKEAMQAWLLDHADMPAVRHKLVFIQDDTKRAESAAKEMRKERTGLEPLDPLASKTITPAERAVLLKQRADNPSRNRQIVE